jgi:hypothetical protein
MALPFFGLGLGPRAVAKKMGEMGYQGIALFDRAHFS